MTPTIRVTSIIISCRAAPSDKFSSSVSEFLAEILTRTVFPILVDGRVTQSVTCYGVTIAWRGSSPGPGAQKPGPRLSQCSAQAGLDTDTGGRVGPHRDEMTIGERERERDGGDSKDDQETRQSRSVSWRNRSWEWYIERNSWERKLDFPVTLEWFRKCELCFCEKFLRCIT